jgi:hypothetical protein
MLDDDDDDDENTDDNDDDDDPDFLVNAFCFIDKKRLLALVDKEKSANDTMI